MTSHTKERAIDILVDSGWLTMTESDVIYLLVQAGIRPSRIGEDLNEIIRVAKIRMLGQVRLAS